MTAAFLSSAPLLISIRTRTRPTLKGVRVQCFQTAKGYSNASSVRGKKRAIGWILQLLRGCTASAPHGEHEAPCGPIWVRSNMHTECLCSLMYRLMYTRALLQSKDHSVGSKRYLSRLEKEWSPLILLEMRPDSPVKTLGAGIDRDAWHTPVHGVTKSRLD